MSIRDRVHTIQTALLGVITPELARSYLVQLTALLGLAAHHLRASELAYKRVLHGELSRHEAAARARIAAECSTEFADYREAKDTHESIKQMMVTCRGYLRSIDEEMRLSR